MPNSVSRSQVLCMTNIGENKLHPIKSRFKQMCFKAKKTKPPVDLKSVIFIDPGRAFHSLGTAILKAHSPQCLNCYEELLTG